MLPLHQSTIKVGVEGVEPSRQDPNSCVLPLYDTPLFKIATNTYVNIQSGKRWNRTTVIINDRCILAGCLYHHQDSLSITRGGRGIRTLKAF